MEDAFWQSRYDKGPAEDYLNCPMDEATYADFYQALLEAPWAETKDFEDEVFLKAVCPSKPWRPVAEIRCGLDR